MNSGIARIFTNVSFALRQDSSFAGVTKEPDMRDTRKDDLFHSAVTGDSALVKQALRDGVDVNVRTVYDRTALHVAVEHGHVEAVKTLLAAGADVNAMDHDRETALDKAALSRCPEIMKALLDAKVDRNFVN